MTAQPVQQESILAHRGPWTEADYFGLPEQEAQRVELVDGGLLVSPHGDLGHQKLGFRLCRELERQLPDDIVAVHEANVRLDTGRLVIPDVVVTRNLSEELVVDAADVVLVGEVVSPWGRARDLILKPSLYSEAGIAAYLLVEREPELALILRRLRMGSHVEAGRAGAGESLDLPDLGVSLEVDALARRR